MPAEYDTDKLARIAQRALNAPDAVLLDHEERPLPYDAYLPGRTVVRFSGHAAVEKRRLAWSSVLKWTDSPATVPKAPIERARREALVYGSGLLDLDGELSVPRAYEIASAADDHVELWLEDIGSDVGTWSLETYSLAAYALGRFNGTFLVRPVPTQPWMVTDWAARQSEPLDMAGALADIEERASDIRVQRALGKGVGHRVARMLKDQPMFIADLGRLPQTLCHHDAARSNLLTRRHPGGGTEVVAIDWESVGPGAVGAEIATLVSGSLRKGDFPLDHAAALETAVVEAYTSGLRDAGWSGDPRILRVGYAMSLALRCWFVRDTLQNLTDPEARPILGRAQHVGTADALDAFVLLSRLLLDRADEARALADSLPPGSLR